MYTGEKPLMLLFAAASLCASAVNSARLDGVFLIFALLHASVR
jgi:hypothetical protein